MITIISPDSGTEKDNIIHSGSGLIQLFSLLKYTHYTDNQPNWLGYAVFIMSKIQIESNSQLAGFYFGSYASCIYHVKDTNRKQFTTCRVWWDPEVQLYLSCQRYKSKAIHNYRKTFYCSHQAVFIMSKIQIESNSQLTLSPYQLMMCCIYHVKDTNRKQFTTKRREILKGLMLYLSCQRYKSKAIHNQEKNIPT